MSRIHKKSRRTAVKLSEAQEVFNRAADFIREGHKLRSKRKGYAPFDKASGYLRREAYALIQETMSKQGGASTIRSLVIRFGETPRTPSYEENPFYWGLLAIDPSTDFLTAQSRSRFARELLYAHKNAVPPKYLIGFIYQTGNPSELASRLKSGASDPSLMLESKR